MATTWRLLFKTTVPGYASVGEFILAAVPGGPSLFTGGVAAASSVYSSGYTADLAFDNNPGTLWSAAGPAPAWVQYSPTTEVSPVELRIASRGDGRLDGTPVTFDLQNDKAAPGTFVTVQSYTAASWTSGQTQTFAVARPATTWRLLFKTIDINNPSMAEFVLAATPGGPSLLTGGAAASQTNYDDTHGFPALAFDGNLSTFWSGVGNAPQWLQYSPAAAISPVELRLTVRNDGYTNGNPFTFDLQNDKDTPGSFVTVQSYTAGPWSQGQTQTFVVPAPVAAPAPEHYSTWRYTVHTSTGSSSLVALSELAMATTPGGSTACFSGTASASSEYNGSYVAANAFDGNGGTCWASAGSVPPDQWIQYTFSAPVSIAELRVLNRTDGYVGMSPGTGTLQGSNDGGTTLTTVVQINCAAWTAAGQTQTFAVPAPASAGVSSATWRILIHATAVPDSPNASGGANYPSLSELIFAGAVGGPSLATGGTAQASSETSGSSAASAFDGNVNTLWGSTTACPIDAWLQYTFASPVSVAEVRIAARNDGVGQYQAPGKWDLQYLNASGSYTTVQSYVSPTWTAGQFQTFAVAAPAAATPAPGSYSTWRVLCHNVPASNVVSIAEIVMASVAGGSTLCSGGTAASSGTVGGFAPANAFDGNASTFWASALSPPSDQWVQYAFATAVSVREIRLTVRGDGNLDQAPGAFDLQGSNDGVTFTTVQSYAAPTWAIGQTQTFAVAAPARAAASGTTWRLLIHATAQPSNGAGASVPTIADLVLATTAGGASAATGGTPGSSSDYSGYPAANAFDGNPATWWNCNGGTPPDQYVQYTFPAAVAIAEVRITPRADSYGAIQSPASFDLQVSSDGATFTTVQSYTAPTWVAGQVQAFAIPVPGAAVLPTAAKVAQTSKTVAGITSTPTLEVSQAYMLVAGIIPAPTINVSQTARTVAGVSPMPALQVSQAYMLVAVSTELPPLAVITNQSFVMMIG